MIEIYTFTFPDSTVYRYTSTVDDIAFNGDTYTSRSGLVRGDVDINPINMDSITTLILPCNDAIVRSYMESPPSLPVSVLIEQLDNGNNFPWFRGIIASVAVSGVTSEFRLVGDGIIQLQQATSLRYQANCRHSLYGLACRVDKENHKQTGTLSLIDPEGLVLTSAGFEDATRKKWIGGAIEIAGQLRTVIAQPATDKIKIDRIFAGIAFVAPYTIFEGCNKTVSTCRDKFNNLANFGGIPNLPPKNPFNTPVNNAFDLPVLP